MVFSSFFKHLCSLQWVPARAVMDLDCLCHPLFWSFCSELGRKVKHWKLWNFFCLTIILQWAIIVCFTVCFLLQAEEILIVTQKTKSWIGITFEVFVARCFPEIWFGIFLYLCFSLSEMCCGLLTCDWSIHKYNSLCPWSVIVTFWVMCPSIAALKCLHEWVCKMDGFSFTVLQLVID